MIGEPDGPMHSKVVYSCFYYLIETRASYWHSRFDCSIIIEKRHKVEK